MILHHPPCIAGVVSTYAGICGKAGDVDGNAAEALFSDVWDVQCLDNCSVLVAEPGSGRIRTIQDSSGTCPASTAGFVSPKTHALACSLTLLTSLSTSCILAVIK